MHRQEGPQGLQGSQEEAVRSPEAREANELSAAVLESR